MAIRTTHAAASFLSYMQARILDGKIPNLASTLLCYAWHTRLGSEEGGRKDEGNLAYVAQAGLVECGANASTLTPILHQASLTKHACELPQAMYRSRMIACRPAWNRCRGREALERQDEIRCKGLATFIR